MDTDFATDSPYDVDQMLDSMGSEFDDDALTLPDDGMFDE